MTVENIQIVLSTIGVLLGLYLAFFKSYVTEKGKNYATKQDIGEITTIVEDAKNNLFRMQNF